MFIINRPTNTDDVGLHICSVLGFGSKLIVCGGCGVCGVCFGKIGKVGPKFFTFLRSLRIKN